MGRSSVCATIENAALLFQRQVLNTFLLNHAQKLFPEGGGGGGGHLKKCSTTPSQVGICVVSLVSRPVRKIAWG